ncbi:MAG: reductive dehalogenase [Candidatus Aminicenantales bacterium]
MKRRQFLKTAGAASAALGSAGLGFFGYEAGKDLESYTGWETHEGAQQTFNRKKHAVDRPHYEKVGPTSRPDARTEVIFYRRGDFMRFWRNGTGIQDMPEHLQEYYKRHPEVLEQDRYWMEDVLPKHQSDSRKYQKEFLLATAWSAAMGAVSPPRISGKPDISDFPRRSRMGTPQKPLKMKSPARTSKLIKKIAHELGATLVGIAKLNPDWVYLYPMRGRGFEPDKPVSVPVHWTYAVVVGTPMSWDPLYANPTYGTSEDAYSRSRIIAFRLAAFLHHLGYAARPHTPGTAYDLMVPPILVDAGLGEQGRHGVVITPELGCNIRPAVVTTNIPLLPDKPIDFGVQRFCRTCKICAENCPSGAITKGAREVVRGYLRYKIDPARCHSFWYSNLGNMGCRICIAVCPYTRKANWLHRGALNLSIKDPTGLSHRILSGLQKRLYPGPRPEDYYIPSFGGMNASYREPPWWLRTEDFIEL